jgi:pectate lyase
VIEVTNLDDIDSSGRTVPGSLRAAIEAKGARIVVFRVGGTINVCERNRKLEITEPYITIAGQTAPGAGIALRLDSSCTESALTIRTHDVVLRHLRIRPGATPVSGENSDALTIATPAAHDVIVDHCSLSWATDENVDISWGANNVTIQNSIVAEGLKDAPTVVGPSGGYGMLITEGDPNGNHTGRITLHHNLFAHNWYRNPQISTNGLIDYRNNVIYDWGLHGLRVMDLYGAARMNIVGNYAKAGPMTSLATREREIWAYHTIGVTAFSYFVSDNLGPRRPSYNDPQLEIIYCREHYQLSESGIDCDPARFSRWPAFPASIVSTSSPTSAYSSVLSVAGATRPRRDSADIRVVDEVRYGTGGDVSNPTQVGGWPWMASATAVLDSDHDGMPDSWEFQYGLNPGGADGALDADADGYTNVEEYLNSTNPRVRDFN